MLVGYLVTPLLTHAKEMANLFQKWKGLWQIYFIMGRFLDLPKDVMWLIIGPVFAKEIFYAYHMISLNHVIRLNVKNLLCYEWVCFAKICLWEPVLIFSQVSCTSKQVNSNKDLNFVWTFYVDFFVLFASLQLYQKLFSHWSEQNVIV